MSHERHIQQTKTIQVSGTTILHRIPAMISATDVGVTFNTAPTINGRVAIFGEHRFKSLKVEVICAFLHLVLNRSVQFLRTQNLCWHGSTFWCRDQVLRVADNFVYREGRPRGRRNVVSRMQRHLDERENEGR